MEVKYKFDESNGFELRWSDINELSKIANVLKEVIQREFDKYNKETKSSGDDSLNKYGMRR